MGAKFLRKKQDGTSNLGGMIKLAVWTLDQFTPDSEWPKRADITANGKSTVVPPLLTTPTQTAARIIFDLETGVKPKSSKSGESTNQVYIHGFEGAKIAGYTAEQNLGFDSIYNQPCVVIGYLADGTRIVLGSTFKPLTINDEFDGGARSGEYKGSTISSAMANGVDFRPVILDSTVVIAEATVAAYS